MANTPTVKAVLAALDDYDLQRYLQGNYKAYNVEIRNDNYVRGMWLHDASHRTIDDALATIDTTSLSAAWQFRIKCVPVRYGDTALIVPVTR